MKQEFPEFILEDKDNIEGGGIVRYGKMYSRKRGRRGGENIP
jgi:hypothetical protein